MAWNRAALNGPGHVFVQPIHDRCLFSSREVLTLNLLFERIELDEICLQFRVLLDGFLGEKKLQGSMMGSNRFPVDMPRLVDMYMSGKLKLDEMISQRIKLEQVNEGFDDMKKGGLARSVIMFD